jgi:hypothetical protein
MSRSKRMFLAKVRNEPLAQTSFEPPIIARVQMLFFILTSYNPDFFTFVKTLFFSVVSSRLRQDPGFVRPAGRLTSATSYLLWSVLGRLPNDRR